jgi:hypothetical protein
MRILIDMNLTALGGSVHGGRALVSDRPCCSIGFYDL